MNIATGIRLMRRRLVPAVTCIDLVQQEGALLSFDVDTIEAENILWEYTGFPGFWPSGFDKPENALRYQLRTFFTSLTPEAAR